MGAVVQPSQGLFGTTLKILKFSGICHAYNNWLVEFVSSHPDRLKGTAMLNVDNPREAAKELERCVDLGIETALFL